MNAQEQEVLKFLKILNDNDLLNEVILIGSWAEYMYAVAGVLPGYEARLRTLDMDFLVKNLRRPEPPVNVSALAKDAGYSVNTDRVTGVTKILSSKGLEIEFLISQKGSGERSYLKTNLGITVQALRHMELLKSETITIEYLGIALTIPAPEAFVLHKMIINGERNEKREKDQQVINSMYYHLDKEKFDGLRKYLTKKELATVSQYIAEMLR